MNNKRLKKIILVVVLVLTVSATWLYANPKNVATYYDFVYEYNSGDGDVYHDPSNGTEEVSQVPSIEKKDTSKNDESDKYSSNLSKEDFYPYIITFVLLVLLIPIKKYAAKKEAKWRSFRLAGSFENRKYDPKLSLNPKLFSKYIHDETEEQFLLDRFQDYIAIQNARMNFDYDVINAKTTDEMYNQYRMQLEMIEKKHQKKIMKDFTFVNGRVVEIQKIEDQTILTMQMNVKFCDYIIDEKTKEIVFGKRDEKISVYYLMVFVRNDKKNTITKCPNCGAEIKKGADTCEFCRSKITKESDEWLLARKRSTV